MGMPSAIQAAEMFGRKEMFEVLGMNSGAEEGGGLS